MKVSEPDVRDWFRAVLAAQTHDAQNDARARRAELQRQSALLVGQQDRLVDLVLADGIDQGAFAAKQTQLRDRAAAIKLQLDVLDRSHDETADLAVKVFELPRTLRERPLVADSAVNRRFFELVALNDKLDDATLAPKTKKALRH